MTKPPRITITTHRRKPALCVRIDGKPRFRTLKNPDQPAAEIQAWLFELAEQQANPIPKKHRKLTIEQHLADWKASLLARRFSQAHAEQTWCAERIIDATGARRVDQLTKHGIEIALANMHATQNPKKTERDEKPLSLGTRNGYIQSIKAFLTWLVEHDRLAKNPAAKIKKHNHKTDPRHQRDRLTKQELAKLIRQTATSSRVVEDYPGLLRSRLYWLAATTGFRRKELASLTPRSFDLDRGLVHVVAACTKNHQEADQPLHPETLPWLRAWLAELPPNEPLFPGLKSKDTAAMIYADLAAVGVPTVTEAGKYRDFHARCDTLTSRACGRWRLLRKSSGWLGTRRSS